MSEMDGRRGKIKDKKTVLSHVNRAMSVKSVSIWRKYGQKFGDMVFFDSRCITAVEPLHNTSVPKHLAITSVVTIWIIHRPAHSAGLSCG